MEIRTKFKTCHKLLFPHFLTGTRVWGVWSDNSDWDCCMLPEEADKLRTQVHESVTITENTWNRGFCFDLCEGYKINIIPLSANELAAWKIATKLMLELPTEKLHDRQTRVTTFKLLLGVTYLHIGIGFPPSGVDDGV